MQRTFDPSFAPSSWGRREVTDDCLPSPGSPPVCVDCDELSLAIAGALRGAANALGTARCFPSSASISGTDQWELCWQQSSRLAPLVLLYTSRSSR